MRRPSGRRYLKPSGPICRRMPGPASVTYRSPAVRAERAGSTTVLFRMGLRCGWSKSATVRHTAESRVLGITITQRDMKPAAAFAPTHLVSTVCPLDCPDSCSLDVTVQDGRVTVIYGSTLNPVTDGYI